MSEKDGNPYRGPSPFIDGRPMTPEEEVRFWRFFYAESLRLFGDKKGTFESLTAKAMRLLGFEAEFVARWKGDYQLITDASSDASKLGDWRRKYIPVHLKNDWLIHTRRTDDLSLRLSKEDAIRQIAKDYRFPSYEAAYKELQRIGIKGLPYLVP